MSWDTDITVPGIEPIGLIARRERALAVKARHIQEMINEGWGFITSGEYDYTLTPPDTNDFEVVYE